MKHGLGRGALRRADEGAEGLRHGEGAEEVRPGQLFVQVVFEPLLGFMVLTRGTVAVTTGMVHAVLAPTRVALREAVAVGAALALWDGADDLAVGGGERGIALKVCWRQGREDIAEGGHDRSLPFRVDALSG